MTRTQNLNLKKPSQSDFYNIDDMNYNSDILDEVAGNAVSFTEQEGRTDEEKEIARENIGVTGATNEEIDAILES